MRGVVFLLLFLMTAPAYADSGSSTADATLAEALFSEAQELVRAGKVESACEKFQESQRIDPAGGTLLNLGDCYRKLGRTASAWSTFKEALTVARNDGRADRVEYLETAISELENRLSKLKVVVPADANTPDLVVKVDGRTLRSAVWGMAVPVDPGSHEVQAEVPGAEAFVVNVDCSDEGETQSVTIPPAQTQGTSANSSPATPADHSPPGRTQRTWGYAIGGLGAGLTVAGGVFGVLAITQWNERNKGCNPGCSADAVDAGDKAQTSAMVANIGLGVGIFALAGGLTLVLTAPEDAPVAEVQLGPQVGLDAVSLGAEVTW